VALIDHFDKRALRLAAVPLGLFVVLCVWCFFPPTIPLGATAAFAGLMLLFYAPVTYLALFRAWGGPWPGDTGLQEKDGIWPAASRGPFGGLWPGLLLVFGTLVVGWWHWGRISRAKEELTPRESWLGPGFTIPPSEETGLVLFGEALPIFGIVMPLIVLGILWFLIPSRP
jgi:hypothetical protein